MSPHPPWCTKRHQPVKVCGDAHAGKVAHLAAINGYPTVTLGLVDGDPVVELATCNHDAVGTPVLLSPEQAEEVAAYLVAAVVRLRETLSETPRLRPVVVVVDEIQELLDPTGAPDRCLTAHVDDRRPCEGQQDAVRIIDRFGDRTPACVLHGAVALASLHGARVHPFNGPDGSAIAVYNRAQGLRPFDFGHRGVTR